MYFRCIAIPSTHKRRLQCLIEIFGVEYVLYIHTTFCSRPEYT